MKSDDLKGQVELATARNFIGWYNKQAGRSLVIEKQEAPDFICRDEIGTIGLEVTICFYDQGHAAMVSNWARGNRERASLSLKKWEPEYALVASINRRLVEKAYKRYGGNCFLIIRVASSPLTNPSEFENEVVRAILVPTKHPFSKIFLTEDQLKFFSLWPRDR